MGSIRLSASRLKSLQQCSWKFYCNEVLKLPETIHPKTITGTCAHSILECLLNPRHKRHYDLVMSGSKSDQSIYNSPVIKRFVKIYQNKYRLDQVLIDDLDSMVMVVLQLTDYLEKQSDEAFPPEHEFLITIGEQNYQIRGFIDRLARKGDLYLIKDYKTQGKRFDEDELANNFQAAMYQLYIWKKFKSLSTVQFIMLRHPPTKRDPQKHIQVVRPRTPEELAGFEEYLLFIGEIFSNFDQSHAQMHFCADDPKTKGFCTYVCQFRNALTYQSLLDKEGNLLKNVFLNETLTPDISKGETVEIRSYPGCPRFLD